MRLLVLALVLMTVSSCLIAKASKVDHNKNKLGRRGLAYNEENSLELNDQGGSKAKFERSKPHINVGGIGHVDKPRPQGHFDNAENEEVYRPIHTPRGGGVEHNNDKEHGRGLVDNNEGNANEGYPSNNVNNHHYIPRQDFSPYAGEGGGGSG